MPLKAALSASYGPTWASLGLPLIAASEETRTMVVEAMEAASEL